MVIQTQSDGAVKVVYENGEYFFVEKGKDPIDRLIDIGLEQQKTAAAIENRCFDNTMIKPELFFVLLLPDYNIKAWQNPQKKHWYYYAITEYNREIVRQHIFRRKEAITAGNYNDHEIGAAMDPKTGKYPISSDGLVPKFVTDITEISNNCHCCSVNRKSSIIGNEIEEQLVSMILINLIYCLVDIRKIEARISEIKGLCKYLEIIAPDAYSAYCSMGDRIGFNAKLDVDRYYQIWNFINDME